MGMLLLAQEPLWGFRAVEPGSSDVAPLNRWSLPPRSRRFDIYLPLCPSLILYPDQKATRGLFAGVNAAVGWIMYPFDGGGSFVRAVSVELGYDILPRKDRFRAPGLELTGRLNYLDGRQLGLFTEEPEGIVLSEVLLGLRARLF